MASESNNPPAGGKSSGGANTAPAIALWQSLRKHWPTAFAVATLVVAATAFYTLGQKKIYQAEATIMFDPNPPRPLGQAVESVVDIGAGSFWNNQEYYETQYHIIQSRGIALAVVRELGLTDDARFLQNLPPNEEPIPSDDVSAEQAAEALRARIQVQPVRDSRLAKVTFQDADPARAQRILSVVVNTYVNINLERAVESTSSATDWLRGQLDGLKKDLESSEHALHEYKKTNDILSVAFDDKSSMLVDQMRLLNEEVTRAESDLGKASARHTQLRAAPQDDPMRIESSVLLASPMLTSLRAAHQSALREYKSLLEGPKGANHPEVVAARDQVKTAEAAVLREIRNVKKAAQRDVREVAGHVGGLKANLDEAKKQAHELNLLEIEYNNLRRSKENTEKLYSLVLERTKESDLSQMMRVNNVSVVDEPLEPGAPIRPRVPLNIVVGLFMGVVLGVAAAFGRGMLDRTLKVPDDIEQELGLTCIGLLPQFTPASQQSAYYAKKRRRRGRRDEQPSGAPELVVHNEPMSSIAEAARGIRTNLMFMAPDEPHKVLLITSAGPSEGKTTVACCIATAMAQAGQRVALIDCDLRRPRLHRVFKKSSTVGVTTALLNENYDEVAYDTEVPDLTITTAGPIPPNPAELLHTERFKHFLAAMRERYDRVIIDSPPVAAVTDPTVLSTLVDATVLVVRAFKTRKDVAKHAVRALDSVSGTLAGVVLNAVDFNRSEYKYSHYYYYRREGYYSDTDRPSAAGGRPSSRTGDGNAAPPPAS